MASKMTGGLKGHLEKEAQQSFRATGVSGRTNGDDASESGGEGKRANAMKAVEAVRPGGPILS